MVDLDSLRRKAAEEAAREVRDGEVIGLGSGGTVEFFIRALGDRARREGLLIEAVPTSYQTSQLALEQTIRLTSLEKHPKLNRAFDGADKVDSHLNALKGGGGCHTREKIVAAASDEFIVLVDQSKIVKELSGNQIIPIEVLPFASGYVMKKLVDLGGRPEMREVKGKLGPVIGDNGGFIVDVVFPRIESIADLEGELNSIPGIIENGIFSDMIDRVYVGFTDCVEIRKKNKKTGEIEIVTLRN